MRKGLELHHREGVDRTILTASDDVKRNRRQPETRQRNESKGFRYKNRLVNKEAPISKKNLDYTVYQIQASTMPNIVSCSIL